MNEEMTVMEPVPAKQPWPFGGDHVMRATLALPEKQRDLVRWLFFNSIATGLSLKEASAAIKYDPTTVGRVMRGAYDGNIGKVCDSISRLKELEESREDIVKSRFVKTRVSSLIFDMCDLALVHQNIATVFGESQIGKTEALLARARAGGRGTAFYVRLPAAASKQGVLRAFAKAFGVRDSRNLDELQERIINAVDANTLLMIDEMHLPFETYQDRVCVKVMAIIREIYDRTHCGMVLVGTNVFRDEIDRGKFKLTLEQLRRRGIYRLQLPNVAPFEDRVAIAASFGFSAPEGHARAVVEEIVRASGLRAYTSFLQAAGKRAANRKQPLSWDHVVAVYETLKAYSQPAA